jgi:hypothetical protein
LVGRPEGRRPLGRPRRRWEIILKWIIKKWDGGMDWIDVAQDKDRWRALVSAVMNLRVPQNAGNFLASWGPVSFSRRTVLHGVIYIYIYIWVHKSRAPGRRGKYILSAALSVCGQSVWDFLHVTFYGA